MSIRDHRTGRTLVRTRNKQPEIVRKAGPHVKQARHEPVICPDCDGVGTYKKNWADRATCMACGGEGEI